MESSNISSAAIRALLCGRNVICFINERKGGATSSSRPLMVGSFKKPSKSGSSPTDPGDSECLERFAASWSSV